MPERETFRVGVDVGGTFTDIFLWSSAGGTESFKVLSTPADPAVGVIDGLARIADEKGVPLADLAGRIRVIVHGTTVTTNAVLTRRGAKTGLLTTEGVRDALEMRRGIRERQYDNRYPNVAPLVPRHRRRPVRGRLDWRGVEIGPLDLDDVRRAAGDLRCAGVEAVAVCFMNSFANPAHERAAAERVRAELPGAVVSVSSDVLPTIRFYNRVSTTVLDAYTGPALGAYLSSLQSRLKDAGFFGVLLIMQSSGGLARPEAVERKPATTLLSGPAAGPHAGAAFARAIRPTEAPSCLVVDMGGTSFDASLVQGGEVALKPEGDIDRLRIALPMLDIVTIGAGGGSIGWIDAGGLLRMGPASAGADPGPACYGRGGDRPTSTDADLVLGYLDPAFFAGGRMTLDPARARAAIECHVGGPLSIGVEEAAAGMYRVINANMAHGVREVTVKRGLDPREFPMVVAGGAGPLHACMIAQELDIPTVLVPQVASVLCASGMLLTDIAHDRVRSVVGRLRDVAGERVLPLVDEMIAEGSAQLSSEAVPPERREHEISVDLRYEKQYHEVTVRTTRDALAALALGALSASGAPGPAGNDDAVVRAFHAEHDRLYGYELSTEGTEIELINVRVRSIGRVDKPVLPRMERGGADAGHARKASRRAFLPESREFATVPVYDGHRLRSQNRILGPALIERTDTTLFVAERFAAYVDDHGTCVVERKETTA